jgi:hypothetical protein
MALYKPAARTSAALAAQLSDETGTGAAVFANTPTLTTPVIGAATGTSLALTTNDATTDATTYVQTLTHTTSGTPANNIGVGVQFQVETAAGNNEIIGSIEGIAYDTTSTSEAGAILFKTMTAGGAAAERMRLLGAGQLFFGADPSSTFTVDSTDAFIKVGITDTNLWNYVQAVFNNNTAGPDIVFAKSRGATVGAHTTVNDGDATGALWSYASDGTNFLAAAALRIFVDGTPGTNDMPGRIELLVTADGAASPTTRLTLDNQGRMVNNIATTTPKTLATNGDLTWTATSNTNLRFSYRGSDGTTRVANLTMA